MTQKADLREEDKAEWLPLNVAAERFGYGHHESLRRRLRQLRQLGYVVDIGTPPADYTVSDRAYEGKVNIMWPNPKTALIRSDTPKYLLNPKRGKRAQIDVE